MVDWSAAAGIAISVGALVGWFIMAAVTNGLWSGATQIKMDAANNYSDGYMFLWPVALLIVIGVGGFCAAVRMYKWLVDKTRSEVGEALGRFVDI